MLNGNQEFNQVRQSTYMKLGIENLLNKVQEINSGCVYYISTEDKDSAVNLAVNCLCKNSDKNVLRYLVLDGVRKEDIRQSQVSDTLLNSVKAHVFESKGSPNFLKSLAPDLKKYGATDEKSLFAVIFDDRKLANIDKFSCYRRIADLQRFAKSYNLSFLLIGYGDHSQSVVNRLLKEDRSLSGLVSFNKTPNQLSLDILYWRADDGTFSQGSYEVVLEESGFAVPESSSEDYAAADINTCYVCENVFTPDSNIYSEVLKFNSQQSLVEEALEKATSATVFLSIDNRDAIDDTARMIYELRTRRGQTLKIIVIEKIAGIRANSEHFLLSCGANYVFSAGSHNSYINTMLPTLLSISYSKRIIMSFEKMLDNYQVLDKEGNGFLMPDAFFAKVEFLLSRKVDEAAVDGTLISLKPKTGLQAQACLSQFKPKRSGDYGTLLGRNIIIYLPSCRNGELAVSLEHIFNTDPTTLFENCDAVYTRAQILAKIDTLKNEPFAQYESSAAMQQIIMRTKSRLASKQRARSMSELAVISEDKPVPFEIDSLEESDRDEEKLNPNLNRTLNKNLF